jgi:hypothetical protein
MNISMVPQMYSDTLANGGGTFNRAGRNVTRGFAVSAIDDTFRIIDIDDKPAFERAILDVAREYPTSCVGTWVHEGNIYIDPADVFTDEATALRWATQRNQIAYYIIHEQREVRL